MLSVRNLRKVYTSKKAEEVVALNNVSIEFPETGFVFLLGKSGSGKSTLLNAIGGLDKFDGGEIIIKGKSSKDFSQADFDSYRNTFIGFIFQEYNILENFTVAKNLALALELQGKKADKAEVMRLLEQVEMQAYANRKPNELSGGQKQRVAIARALIKNPEIIMADEPTGALDSNTGKQVMDTLKELSKTKLIIVVSHDREFAEYYGDRIIELKDGKILHDTTRKEVVAEETKSGIKIIDDDIVYIKKGQEIGDAELKQIGKIIVDKAKDNDAFISFNKEANAKVKEGAKINDDGNKEKFLKTEPEDVKTKQYNPNSLKLIKSHLGFKDSFKMGASSLKNKVGKLVFTILLSFFAFTCFGIIDALSQWNRASSVYDAMKISDTKVVVMKKQKQTTEDGYTSTIDKSASEQDLADMQEKFKDYTFLGAVGGDGYSSGSSIYMGSYQVGSSYSENPTKQVGISYFVNINDQNTLQNLGFELVKGDRLPENQDSTSTSTTQEIAISKFLMQNMIKATENQTDANKITESNIIGKEISISNSSINNYKFKIVAVIDTKIDLSKYESMSDADFSSGMTGYLLRDFLSSSPASFGYVSEEIYNVIKETQKGTYLNYLVSGVTNGGGSLYKDGVQTLESLYQEAKNNLSGGSFKLSDDKEALLILNGNSYKLYTNDCCYEYDINSGSLENVMKYDKRICRKSPHYLYQGNSEYSTLESIISKFGSVNVSNDYTREMFLIQYFYFTDGDVAKLLSSDKSAFKMLADDECISSPFSYEVEEALDDIVAVRNGDVSVNIYEGYANSNKDPEVSAKVVALYYNQNDMEYESTLVVSSNTYKKLASYYGTYNLLISALTGNETTDKELISMCETYNKNNIRFQIQNNATMVLDTLEDVVTEVAPILVWVAVAFAVFAALMLMNFISTSISYKKREIGVLRALGARGSDVFGIFLNESSIIALINFVLSALATVIGCKIINSSIINSLGYSISLLNVGIRQVVLILAISWGSAFIASLLPTSKISRKKPIDAINNR